ncbi:hypothetical protein RJ640_029204 [Escallonia rubra]|uniref:Uncharacterized protein n=1 Tax=Escallonia rubra TaxID=112253 RepID=A0AA88U827_9ASTE|nr:hypothetical protein RJ640_029204 [Escallonia rubra]
MRRTQTSLEQIGACGCGVKGTIPSEVGNLSSLAFLNLLANDLIGSIPVTIKGIQKLEVLILSNNKIQGSILIQLDYKLGYPAPLTKSPVLKSSSKAICPTKPVY